MSHKIENAEDNAITTSGISRVIPCRELDTFDCFKWIALAFNDFKNAKAISLFYGAIFAIIPVALTYWISSNGWYLFIFPAMLCFMLLGPYFAAGLYDVSWQFEKKHKPSLRHSLKAMSRNAVNEWGFGIMLMIIMLIWLRAAAFIHVFFPTYLDYTFINLWPFLAVGTAVGAGFSILVFCLSVFTQPILLERKVDLATAVLSSLNAVWRNRVPMFVWAMCIVAAFVIGFATLFVGFLVIMPILGYATWHGYIDTIDIKRQRSYE